MPLLRGDDEASGGETYFMSTKKPIQRYHCQGDHLDMISMPEGDYILFSDHEKALAEKQSKNEVELARGQQWCADFIAMRKERDQLQSALAEQLSKANLRAAAAEGARDGIKEAL